MLALNRCSPASMQVEVPNGLQRPAKDVAAWNGKRTHHMDAHLLNDGTWVAAIDGDSMHSVRGLPCMRMLAFRSR